MYTLVAFATQWGTKYGGINSFNCDFLKAFGVAYFQNVQVVCLVASAESRAIEDAAKSHVRFFPQQVERRTSPRN
jgi:hypothetical protein